jgi:hypothetical protein
MGEYSQYRGDKIIRKNWLIKAFSNDFILNLFNKHLFQILQISAFVFLKFYRSPVNKSSDPIFCTGSRYFVRSISLG